MLLLSAETDTTSKLHQPHGLSPTLSREKCFVFVLFHKHTHQTLPTSTDHVSPGFTEFLRWIGKRCERAKLSVELVVRLWMLMVGMMWGFGIEMFFVLNFLELVLKEVLCFYR